jgi:hypothetical protein
METILLAITWIGYMGLVCFKVWINNGKEDQLISLDDLLKYGCCFNGARFE